MSSNVDSSALDDAKSQNGDQMQTSSNLTSAQQQSKLSGLKAPSKIVRPSIPTISKPLNSSQAPSTSNASLNSTLNNNNQNNTVKSAVSSTTLNDDEILDFKVNDKCWVNGTKSGTIAFIGETQFKEGVWVGVILDATGEGKNNGTVGGVTYFKTEEARGVFCRMNKLTKTQMSESGASTGTSLSFPDT